MRREFRLSLEAGRDVMRYASRSSWFEWEGESSLIFEDGHAFKRKLEMASKFSSKKQNCVNNLRKYSNHHLHQTKD